MKYLQIGIITFILLFSAFFVKAESIKKNPSFKTEHDVAEWLSHEFSYAWEMPDRLQTPQETISLRRGDCEDFAVLSQELLDKVDIRCEIAIIKFKDLDIAHAICIWQDKDNYKFMSNNSLVETKAGSVEEAIEKTYPDWEKIIFTDSQKKPDKVLKRKDLK